MRRQGLSDLVRGGAQHEPVEVVETPAGPYVAAVADSVGGGFSRVLHAAKVRHTEGCLQRPRSAQAHAVKQTLFWASKHSKRIWLLGSGISCLSARFRCMQLPASHC